MLLMGTKRMLGRVTAIADGGCIGCIIFAALAREAVGDDELGRNQAHGVAELLELACPVVGTGASFHADQARRDRFRW